MFDYKKVFYTLKILFQILQNGKQCKRKVDLNIIVRLLNCIISQYTYKNYHIEARNYENKHLVLNETMSEKVKEV